jgi:hypothetical protein
MIKYLYETVLNKEVEENIVDKKIEDGKEIVTTTPIKKLKKVKIAIQQPDRKLSKGAELFYSKSLANYLKQGLMPYSLVAKRYANDGGPLTEDEIKRVNEIKQNLKLLEQEFFTTLSETITDTEKNQELVKKKTDILLKINAANAELSTIQNSYTDIFDNTAEMKSHHDTIEWLSLYLINIDEDGKGYKPLFGIGDPTKQEDYLKKVEKLEEFEDKNDKFYNEIIKKLSYLISFWFTAKTSLSQNDFKTMENLYNDSLSNYHVAELEETTNKS